MANVGKATGRKPIRVSLGESKTLALYRAGQGMLAEMDFEDMALAAVSEAAGMSVGAFYVRFSDKVSFLRFVIRHTCLEARQRFESALDGAPYLDPEAAKGIFERLVEIFDDPVFAGVVRAAVKLGLSDPVARLSLDRFNAYWLAEISAYGDTDQTREALKFALQSAFAVMADHVLRQDAQRLVDSDAIVRALALRLIKDLDLESKPLVRNMVRKIEDVEADGAEMPPDPTPADRPKRVRKI